MLACFGTILDGGANLVEKVEALFDLALRVGRVRTLLRSDGATRDVSIAGVEIAEYGSVTIASRRITCGARDAVAHLATLIAASLIAAALSTTLATLTLTTLTGLPTLPRLAVLGLLLTLLAGTAPLTALSRLTLTLTLGLACLRIGTRTESGDLIAKTREIIHGAADRSLVGIALAAAHGAGRLAHLLTEFLQIVGKRGFRRVGETAAAQLIGAPLESSTEVVFIHARQRTAQFARRRGLGRSQFAGCGAHLLGQTGQFVADLLAIVDHLVDVLSGRILRLFARSLRGILLRHQLTNVVGLLLLSGGELFGRLGHGADSTGCVLLLQSAEEVGGLAETVGRAPGIGGAGTACRGASHVVIRLAQAVERLLCRLASAVGGLGAVGSGTILLGGGAARLSAALAGSSARLA